jgi:DNA-binding NarL/FixJ family response regulator
MADAPWESPQLRTWGLELALVESYSTDRRVSIPSWVHMSGDNGSTQMDYARPDLTEQERLILEYVLRGYSTGMIASALGTSHRTIEALRWALLKKFGAHNSIQMVRAGLRQGFLEL